MPVYEIWPVLRGILRELFSFTGIKEIAGESGLPVHRLAHLQQTSGGASKGQLIDGLDGLFAKLDATAQARVTVLVVRQIWNKREDARDRLAELLERVGWGITDGEPYPLTLQADIDTAQLSDQATDLLRKCLSRYRDGDLDGSVTAICSIVDDLTDELYARYDIHGHRTDSYQQRVASVVNAQRGGFLEQLADTEVEEGEVRRIWENLRGAINQAAYVLGAFRREFSDVHGTNQAPPSVVQQALNCAVFIIRSLIALA